MNFTVLSYAIHFYRTKLSVVRAQETVPKVGWVSLWRPTSHVKLSSDLSSYLHKNVTKILANMMPEWTAGISFQLKDLGTAAKHFSTAPKSNEKRKIKLTHFFCQLKSWCCCPLIICSLSEVHCGRGSDSSSTHNHTDTYLFKIFKIRSVALQFWSLIFKNSR